MSAPLRWSRIEKPKSSTVIVFVPHFGAKANFLNAHIRWMNQLGFDAATVRLRHNSFRRATMLPLNSELKFGLRHVWIDQIEDVFNHIRQPKIVFSFSLPSAAALLAISRRQAIDIQGWICEGGPFADLIPASWRLFTHTYPIQNLPLRALASGVAPFFLGRRGLKKELHSALHNLPDGFPILSVRGWQDPLVPAAAIDDVFKDTGHLNYQVLALPEGKHVDGLIHHSADYKPRIEGLVKQWVTQPAPPPHEGPIVNGHSSI